MRILEKLKDLITQPEILPEVLQAYLYKLPDQIHVKWFRDGEFIIGEITTPEKKFMTQAKSGTEFIEMVNDAIYTVYDVPRHYAELAGKFRAFTPPAAELEKLDDGSIKNSNMQIEKRLVAAG